MSEIKGIASKIVKVMEGIESVSKDGFNAFHKYKYVTDAAIVTEIRKSMIANKVVAIPKQLSCSQNGDLTTIQVEYTLIDAESGESLTSLVYGYGQDKGDKGIYKAATGAEKYFLMKTFLLATDDDPEDDSKEIKTQVNKGTNTGVRVPAGYWKLRENDPQGAQELLGGDGYYPGKTDKGYFVFTTKSADEEKAFVESLGKRSPEPPKNEAGSPTLNENPKNGELLISGEQQLEIVKLAKNRGLHHLTAKKVLKDKFGYDGTAKIKVSDYLKVYEFFDSYPSAGIGA